MTCTKHEPVGVYMYPAEPVMYLCGKCGEKYTLEIENMKAQVYTPQEAARIQANMAPQNKPIKL